MKGWSGKMEEAIPQLRPALDGQAIVPDRPGHEAASPDARARSTPGRREGEGEPAERGSRGAPSGVWTAAGAFRDPSGVARDIMGL